MGKKSRSIPDHISKSLETIFWFKILEFFDADPDPGIQNLFDPGSAMENSDPGSIVISWIRNTACKPVRFVVL
jgi:hypothetical protein